MTTSHQPPATSLSFAVIGVGPVGGILSAWLARAGHRVAVADVDRAHVEAIRRDGIAVTGVREATGRPERAVLEIGELAGERYDYVVVATKASLLGRVMPEVAKIAGKDTPVASFQNGLDTEVDVAKVVGAERTLRAVINYAGGRAGDGRLQMVFFTGHNAIGHAAPAGEAAARRLAEVVTAAGLETDYSPEVRKYEWEKTILNAAMSPLGALTSLTMRECVEMPRMIAMTGQLIDEGIAVAKADGYAWDAGFRQDCLGYLSKAGHHRPSLWVDVFHKRPTEIRYLNGRIADIAEQHGVPAPTHRILTTLIEGIERHWASEHEV